MKTELSNYAFKCQYYSRSSGEPGPTWGQIHIYIRLHTIGQSGQKGRGTHMCQWHPFWIGTHKSRFQKMKNTRSPIRQKPQLFTAWPLRDLVFSLIYSARIIKPWQLCFTVWRCVNTGCEQHVTALQNSYYDPQFCLHSKRSLRCLVDSPFRLLQQLLFP